MKEQNKILPISGQSKFSNSNIGSHHWAATLLSYVMRVGEYLNNRGAVENLDMTYRGWGLGIKERATEINDYLHSLPEFKSSLQPTIEELQKENDSLKKQLHDHNGMCQQKLSDQLKEVMPDIESKSKRIKELEEALLLLKDSIDFAEQEHNASYVITQEDKRIIESVLNLNPLKV